MSDWINIENSQATKREYQLRFPNTSVPHHETFSLVFHNLQANKSFIEQHSSRKQTTLKNDLLVNN